MLVVRLSSNVSTVSKHVISDRGAWKSWQGSTCLAKLMAGSSADGREARSAAFVGLEVLAAGCRSDCGLNHLCHWLFSHTMNVGFRTWFIELAFRVPKRIEQWPA